ncbi:ribonuclease III [bacterium]|nr:ribonuclease III [bacterium]
MQKALENIFKIEITDVSLFKKALTHPSFTKENNISSFENYERLEFFGDSVLKLAVSEILIKKYKNSNEGELSKIRSILVSDAILAKITEQLNITDLIILGEHAEKTGERNCTSIKACVFEALLGAFYLDNKKEEIFEFLTEIIEPYTDEVKNNLAKYNSKELLQEYTQGKTKELPKYTLLEELGPKHSPTFRVQVMYQNRILATAIGKSKKDAEQKCAYEACIKLGVINE